MRKDEKKRMTAVYFHMIIDQRLSITT